MAVQSDKIKITIKELEEMYDIEGYVPIKDNQHDIPEEKQEEDSITFDEAIKKGDKELQDEVLFD